MGRIAGNKTLADHISATVAGDVLAIGMLVSKLLLEKDSGKLLVTVLDMHDKLHKPELKGSRGIVAIKAEIKRIAKNQALLTAEYR